MNAKKKSDSHLRSESRSSSKNKRSSNNGAEGTFSVCLNISFQIVALVHFILAHTCFIYVFSRIKNQIKHEGDTFARRTQAYTIIKLVIQGVFVCIRTQVYKLKFIQLHIFVKINGIRLKCNVKQKKNAHKNKRKTQKIPTCISAVEIGSDGGHEFSDELTTVSSRNSHRI